MQAIVLDDSRTARVAVKRLLQDLGAWPVHEAPDGAAALALLAADPEIDLVAVDASIAPMAAGEFLRAVRAAAARPALRLLVLAAEGEMPAARAMVQDGAHAALARPLTAETLGRAVRELGLVEA